MIFLTFRNVCNARVLDHNRNVVLQDRPKIKKNIRRREYNLHCSLVRCYECTSE